jgi:hypothetical protein
MLIFREDLKVERHSVFGDIKFLRIVAPKCQPVQVRNDLPGVISPRPLREMIDLHSDEVVFLEVPGDAYDFGLACGLGLRSGWLRGGALSTRQRRLKQNEDRYACRC